MSKGKFNQLFKQLNPAQAQAVEAIDGPVMVIAGPGTGKTQILTLRIANILLKTDTPPDAVLALTFTRSGVHSMRKRLVEIIGSAGYRVAIHTFHGFCNNIIRDYAEEFPRIIGSAQATIIDQVKILREIIHPAKGGVDTLKLNVLKPYGNPYYHLVSILGEIERFKRENVSPADLLRLLKANEKHFKENTPDLYYEKGARAGQMRGKYRAMVKSLAKNLELYQVYKKYEEALRDRKLYDFGDMVMEVLRELRENKDLLLTLQEEYQYLLADEHQDANQAQNELLKLLASYYDEPNLFIVGDDKQAIFQFQGASLDNFNYFKKLFPTAKLIVLTDNYRSTQTILDAAHSLIQADSALSAETRGILLAKNKIKGEIKKAKLLAFSTLEQEVNYLIGEARERLKNDQESVAIIYRDNADARPLVAALERAGLAFTLYAEESLFADRDIAKLLTLLRAVSDFGDETYLAASLQLDFIGLPLNIIYELFHRAKEDKKKLFQVIAESEEKKVKKFYDNYSAWHKLAQNATLINFFETIIKESGFVDDLLKKPEVADKLNKLRGLFDLVKNLSEKHHEARLGELVEYLDLAIAHNLKIGEASPLSGGGVQLLTAHKSKGLEFDHVYIINSRDGHWGNRRKRSFSIPLRGLATVVSGDDNADERRLFYVALTRAKKSVTITYPVTGEAGQNYLQTQFVEEMNKELIEVVTPEEIKKEPEFLTPRRYTGPKFSDKEYLKDLFLTQGLSVTALNNYLDCPWKYFFQNMLRMPAAKTRYLIYGTAVHAGLATFFDNYKNTEKLDKKLLLKTFETSLESEPLSPGDFKILKEKGEKSLAGYFKLYQKAWPVPLYNEFQVKGIKLTPEIKLKGVIDKIEPGLDDTVHVVDYKTGKPKPRSDKNYFRQLVFYKILLERFSDKFKVNSGTLDYIEPNDRGIYKKEEFELKTEDAEKVVEQIKSVAEEILTLKFWRTRCGKPDCEFCRLRNAMKD